MSLKGIMNFEQRSDEYRARNKKFSNEVISGMLLSEVEDLRRYAARMEHMNSELLALISHIVDLPDDGSPQLRAAHEAIAKNLGACL